jgi:lipopolysaccharide transport system permease protein
MATASPPAPPTAPAGPPRPESKPPRTARPVLDIEPTQGWRGINLADLWRYRDLLYIFVWRDLKVRYRQTLLGAVWVMGQPLLTMLIFTFLFNRLAHIETDSPVPYEVFVMAGLLPWTFFANGVQNSGNSLIGSSHLISKVYFPRLLIPASSVVAALVDFAVSGVVLVGLMVCRMPWSQLAPGVHLLLLPVALVLAFALTLGVGLWMSALNVEYRDVRVVIPFLLQLWMFATPVVYPFKLLPAAYQPIAIANPMTGIVETWRYAILGPAPDASGPWLALATSVALSAAVLVSGAFFFRRMERQFADIL